MGTFQIILLAVQVLWKLIPIAREVYEGVQDPTRPAMTADNALEWIKDKAVLAGLPIGDTEAELVRSAIHYALAKGDRHWIVSSE